MLQNCPITQGKSEFLRLPPTKLDDINYTKSKVDKGEENLTFTGQDVLQLKGPGS